MAQVEVEVLDTAASSEEKTVAITNSKNHPEYLQVPATYLQFEREKAYLTVSVIHVDRATGQLLIQLPFEADSGANRLWILKHTLLRPDEVAIP